MHAPAVVRCVIVIGTAAAACPPLARWVGAQGTSASHAPTTSVAAGQTAPALAASATAAAMFRRPGVYVYVPDPGQAVAIKQAVDRAVRHMFPIVRSIARRRLMDTNKMPDTLRVIVTRDTLGTQTDRDKAMDLPRSGITIRWDDGTGDVCRARDSVVADTLMQFCDTKSGGSVARYVLLNGGQRLRMIVHITSSHLSGPVDYAVEFRKESRDETVESR